jgi:xylitol oxidase
MGGFSTNRFQGALNWFDVRQVVYENLSLGQLEHHLDEIFWNGYSVSLFTDWQNHRATQVWIKSRVEQGVPFTSNPEFFGAKAATKKGPPAGGAFGRELHRADGHTRTLV